MAHWKEEFTESRGFPTKLVIISTQQQEGNQLKGPLVNGSLFSLSNFSNLQPFYVQNYQSTAVSCFTKAGPKEKKCYKTLQRKFSFQKFIGLDEKMYPIYL